MDWKAFYREIQEGTFRSVYLFSGPEEHLKRKAVEALEKAILPAGMEEMNRTRLEGADAQRILEAAETSRFLRKDGWLSSPTLRRCSPENRKVKRAKQKKSRSGLNRLRIRSV